VHDHRGWKLEVRGSRFEWVWRWFICLFQNVGNVEYGKKDVKVRQMSESGKVEKWNGGKVFDFVRQFAPVK